jgi:NRPS condensation-like uncharacterized protein
MTGLWPGAWRFSVVDELTCYLDSPAEPANIHLEAWLTGHLDVERLRHAVAAVMAAQPLARARRVTGGWWRTSYIWTVPPEADCDPVSVTSWQAEPELDAARAGFLTTAPLLDQSPPFRLLLARGTGLDSLILNANHAAFDGRSCLALMRMIADAYGAAAYSAGAYGAEVYSAAAYSAAAYSAAAYSAGAYGADVYGAAANCVGLDRGTGGSVAQPDPAPARPASPVTAPGMPSQDRTWRVARIAARPADRHAPGYGFRLLDWPGVPVPLRREAGQQSRATVNDLLVAALIETIARWNAALRRPPRPIRITIPVDVRPSGRDDELGNKSALCTVTMRPNDADADRVTVVSAQTQQAKQRPGRMVGGAQSVLAKTPLPTPVKRRLLRAGVRCLGSLTCDTSLLSNLGNVTDPLRFGHLTAERIWFSTFAHMPRGLSLGAITVGGRLQLCFRYRLALLDDAAAAEFADIYTKALASLMDSTASWTALPHGQH